MSENPRYSNEHGIQNIGSTNVEGDQNTYHITLIAENIWDFLKQLDESHGPRELSHDVGILKKGLFEAATRAAKLKSHGSGEHSEASLKQLRDLYQTLDASLEDALQKMRAAIGSGDASFDDAITKHMQMISRWKMTTEKLTPGIPVGPGSPMSSTWNPVHDEGPSFSQPYGTRTFHGQRGRQDSSATNPISRSSLTGYQREELSQAPSSPVRNLTSTYLTTTSLPSSDRLHARRESADSSSNTVDTFQSTSSHLSTGGRRRNQDEPQICSAAREGQLVIVEHFIKSDPEKADVIGKDRRTPLSLAAGNGHFEIVKLLLSRSNVDINSRCGTRRTPLSYAAQAGHEQVVKLLLANKEVLIDRADTKLRTPQYFAEKAEKYEIVKMIKNKRSGVDNNGCTDDLQ